MYILSALSFSAAKSSFAKPTWYGTLGHIICALMCSVKLPSSMFEQIKYAQLPLSLKCNLVMIGIFASLFLFRFLQFSFLPQFFRCHAHNNLLFVIRLTIRGEFILGNPGYVVFYIIVSHAL